MRETIIADAGRVKTLSRLKPLPQTLDNVTREVLSRLKPLPQVMACDLLLLPEVGVLDAQCFRVECIFLDARLALRFIVFERLDCGLAHEKEN